MATAVGLNYALPSVAAKTGSIYGYTASTLETDIKVEDGAITGTLNFIDSGQLADWWGEGYFLALQIGSGDSTEEYASVGLIPSEGSGFVNLDDDRDLAAKITDKVAQNFAVISSDGIHNYWQIFQLDDIELNDGE